MSDTLADMITRIRNGQKANKISVKAIFSKLNVNVCDVLKKEGYIDNFEILIREKKEYENLLHSLHFSIQIGKFNDSIQLIKKLRHSKFRNQNFFYKNRSKILFLLGFLYHIGATR